mmetsp:Transcript_5834/g.6664  ORF Transcript_5834/g.6664 Transcript_5834/m.6664 type:complete len:247 (-) Transcript_5834:24-764(-)
MVSLAELWEGASVTGELNSLKRIVFPRSIDGGQVDSVTAAINSSRYPLVPVVVCSLPASGWKGVLRNVPKHNRLEGSLESKSLGIGVFRNENVKARRLVLLGLKYPGNTGTIIRCAVQSNLFSSVIFVGMKPSNDDVNWYSLQNAPLINIDRFENVQDFLEAVPKESTMTAVELSPRSLDLYSIEARSVLKKKDSFLVLGAEDTGTPVEILERCQELIEIPSMSASINVSCAFAAVLSVMHIADRS